MSKANVRRRSTTWYFLVDAKILGASVTDETDDATVTYTTTHNGAAYSSGSMTWEPDGFDNQWGVKLNLPSTPGIFTVSVRATVDTDIGDETYSVEVV